MYGDCKAKVMATLQQANHVILTTDMWTSRSTEAYLTVTCHFIDNWQMQECVRNLPFHCTADNISAELKRIAEEWGITQKCVQLSQTMVLIWFLQCISPGGSITHVSPTL